MEPYKSIYNEDGLRVTKDKTFQTYSIGDNLNLEIETNSGDLNFMINGKPFISGTFKDGKLNGAKLTTKELEKFINKLTK